MFFRLVTSVGQRKNSLDHMRNRTPDLRIPRSDALPLSHRDSLVSEVCHEVHMTRVLHTARISDVDSVMLVHRFTNMTLCSLMGTLNFFSWSHTCDKCSRLIILSSEGPFENYHGIISVLKLDVSRSPPEMFRTMRFLPPSFSKA